MLKETKALFYVLISIAWSYFIPPLIGLPPMDIAAVVHMIATTLVYYTWVKLL